jgi:hypothetical protein
MKAGDLIKHCKYNRNGVILFIKNNYAEILWLKIGMYKPEIFHINELEVIKNG